MEYDFLNIRAIFTESSEGSTTGVLEMYTLEEGNTKDKIQHFQVFNFNKADQEFKQFIIEKIYPVPAVQPPEGSPERNFGNNTQYKHQRKAAYPEIGEQLDMLYKDMLEGSSSFIEAITNIKNSIPKSPKFGIAYSSCVSNTKSLIFDITASPSSISTPDFVYKLCSSFIFTFSFVFIFTSKSTSK